MEDLFISLCVPQKKEGLEWHVHFGRTNSKS